jgi:hypothetical protein
MRTIRPFADTPSRKCAVGRCIARADWVIAYPRTFAGTWGHRRRPITMRIVSLRCDRHVRIWAARWKLPMPFRPVDLR